MRVCSRTREKGHFTQLCPLSHGNAIWCGKGHLPFIWEILNLGPVQLQNKTKSLLTAGYRRRHQRRSTTTRQILGRWFDIDVDTQASYWCARVVHRWAFQSLAGRRSFPYQLQSGVRHTDCEEAGTRRHYKVRSYRPISNLSLLSKLLESLNCCPPADKLIT